jgi:hypothetical protein
MSKAAMIANSTKPIRALLTASHFYLKLLFLFFVVSKCKTQTF